MDPEQTVIELVGNMSCLQLPIGVYVVAPDGHFIAANKPLRALLQLPSHGPIDISLADFYAQPGRRAELVEQALAADEHGLFLEKELIHFRVAGDDVFVESFCKPLRDPNTQALLGFVGCLVDISTEHIAELQQGELQQKVQELTTDIGRVLHANTTTLIMGQQTLDAVEEVLRGAPFDLLGNIQPMVGQSDEVLLEAAVYVAEAIERMLESGEEERRLKALPAAKWQVLAARADFLRNLATNVPLSEMRLPVLRKAAHQIADLCREIQPRLLSREIVRTTQKAAEQLERLVCLIDVANTRSAIVQMDYTLRALRDFVTSDIREPVKKARVPFARLIEQAIVQLAAFAKSSNIEIVLRDRAPNAEVEGMERDLVRALTNLLHNAIKYTWTRNRTGSPWVTIRITEQADRVVAEFENWGVPIARDELKKDLIFQLGYRGMWSTDRGRLGTGIGLTDSRRVAQSHGGDLCAQSKPASPSLHSQEDAEYYKQPFVTTFSFSLPLAGSARTKR